MIIRTFNKKIILSILFLLLVSCETPKTEKVEVNKKAENILDKYNLYSREITGRVNNKLFTITFNKDGNLTYILGDIAYTGNWEFNENILDLPFTISWNSNEGFQSYYVRIRSNGEVVVIDGLWYIETINKMIVLDGVVQK